MKARYEVAGCSNTEPIPVYFEQIRAGAAEWLGMENL